MKKLFITILFCLISNILFAQNISIPKIRDLYSQNIHDVERSYRYCDNDMTFEYKINTSVSELSPSMDEISYTLYFEKVSFSNGLTMRLSIYFDSEKEMDNFVEKTFNKVKADKIPDLFTEFRNKLIENGSKPLNFRDDEKVYLIMYGGKL
jgi:hypothetical protein